MKIFHIFTKFSFICIIQFCESPSRTRFSLTYAKSPPFYKASLLNRGDWQTSGNPLLKKRDRLHADINKLQIGISTSNISLIFFSLSILVTSSAGDHSQSTTCFHIPLFYHAMWGQDNIIDKRRGLVMLMQSRIPDTERKPAKGRDGLQFPLAGQTQRDCLKHDLKIFHGLDT